MPSVDESVRLALAALEATRVALMEKETRARAAKTEQRAGEVGNSESGDEVLASTKKPWNPSVVLNEIRSEQAVASAGTWTAFAPSATERETEEFAVARALFCQQALRYVGTDYDTIDCCGLVRQCVHDLPELFNGFRLDRCNQGVMLETLNGDGVISDPRDMRPGDLIFYISEVGKSL